MPETHTNLGLRDGEWELLGRALRLSAREQQIVRLAVADRKERAIATALCMSPHTVRTHMERVYHKLGINSRGELIVRIMHTFLQKTAEPDSPLPPICGRRTAGSCPFVCG
jgi:DNA-binding CsgD family transcriptional regulator